jgi:lysyl-tRNA synthetase class II
MTAERIVARLAARNIRNHYDMSLGRCDAEGAEMTDIAERLRSLNRFGSEHFALLYEAADEITILRNEVQRYRMALKMYANDKHLGSMVAINALEGP